MSIVRSILGIAVSAAIYLPDTALAYVGPGAGLGAIGTLIALVGAVLLAIVGFVWYPIKRLLRKHRTAAELKDDEDGAAR